MSKTSCPAGCGKQFTSWWHAAAHADTEHAGWNEAPKARRQTWRTPYGFGEFIADVTYDEAYRYMGTIAARMAKQKENS